MDPYVKLDVFGLGGDDCEFTSKVVDDNGFNPLWNEEFKFTVGL